MLPVFVQRSWTACRVVNGGRSLPPLPLKPTRPLPRLCGRSAPGTIRIVHVPIALTLTR